jgi:ADP-ribose pyrophosphatase
MPGFRPVSGTPLWQGRIFSVERGEFEIDGEVFGREIVRHPGSVAVVPFTGERIVLLHQYRPALDKWIYEIPAGKRDIAGEEPSVTAIRECVEETGYRPGRVTLLHRFYNSPGYTDEETHLFVAEGLTKESSMPAGLEELHAGIIELEPEEAFRMVANSEVVDAKTLLGLYSVLQRLT